MLKVFGAACFSLPSLHISYPLSLQVQPLWEDRQWECTKVTVTRHDYCSPQAPMDEFYRQKSIYSTPPPSSAAAPTFLLCQHHVPLSCKLFDYALHYKVSPAKRSRAGMGCIYLPITNTCGGQGMWPARHVSYRSGGLTLLLQDFCGFCVCNLDI